MTGLDGSLQPCTAPFVVLGRNISRTGISIRHPIPSPFRFVAIQFDESQIEILSTWTDTYTQPLVAKFAWVRYVSQGEYISGGRFLNLNVKLSEYQSSAEWHSF